MAAGALALTLMLLLNRSDRLTVVSSCLTLNGHQSIIGCNGAEQFP